MGCARWTGLIGHLFFLNAWQATPLAGACRERSGRRGYRRGPALPTTRGGFSTAPISTGPWSTAIASSATTQAEATGDVVFEDLRPRGDSRKGRSLRSRGAQAARTANAAAGQSAAGATGSRRARQLHRDSNRRQRTRGRAGHVPIHRLNRTEYALAVQDLLGVEIDAAKYLPNEDRGRRFHEHRRRALRIAGIPRAVHQRGAHRRAARGRRREAEARERVFPSTGR